MSSSDSVQPPDSSTRTGDAWVGVAIRWTVLLLVCEAFILWILNAKSAGAQPMRIYFELIRRMDGPALPVFAFVGAFAIWIAVRQPRIGEIARWAGDHALLLGTCAFVGYGAGALLVFQGHPLSMDEYAPLFQSKAFAAGRPHGSVPPQLIDAVVPRSFQGEFFQVDHLSGAIASRYWPAFALLQAPFALFDGNWLFNPLVGALSVPALDSLLRRLGFDAECRGAALLATVASGAIAFNAMSFYAMPLILLSNIVFTRLVLDSHASALWGAGVVGSIALTALNPVPHATYALPWLIWIAFRSPGGLRRLGWLALGYAPLAVVLGLGWPLAYLHFVPGSAAGSIESIAALFKVFASPTAEVIVARAFALAKLDLWAVPGLIALAIAGALVWRTSSSRCLAASAAVTALAYLFVPFDQGHGWGYRYFHHAWLALPVLAAGALSTMPSGLVRRKVVAFVVASSVVSICVLLPMRAAQVERFVRGHFQQIPQRDESHEREIVFIDAACGYYASDLVQSDPFLRGTELRFSSLGAESDRRIAQQLLRSPQVKARTACARRWTPG